MTENVLPCPFCGGSNLALVEGGMDYHDTDNPESWAVWCECGIKTPFSSIKGKSKEEAIAFWNNRHELNSIDVYKKEVATGKKSFTACLTVEHTVIILADDLEEATEKAESCDWEEGSDMSPDFDNLKWIEEDE